MEGEDRYAVLVGDGLARVTGFEPNDVQRAKLVAERPGDAYRYINAFIGTGEEATVHVTRYPGCTSLYRPDPRVIDRFDDIGTTAGGNFHVIGTARVQTRRLDDIAECPPADFLKLDVQGGELDALRGAGKSLANAIVL